VKRVKESAWLSQSAYIDGTTTVCERPSPQKAPNSQAFVERFIGLIRRECLNHFVSFGAKHLDAVACVWLAHYHAERPHQGYKNELLV
jgi:putative transposase